MDARGIPLSLVASGANTHDVKLLEATLEARVVKPDSTVKTQHLCADAAYVGQSANQLIGRYGLIAHVRSRKQETAKRAHGLQAKPRRWVTHSWFNRFRKHLVRFEKTAAAFEALLSLAAALICWRQKTSIYG